MIPQFKTMEEFLLYLFKDHGRVEVGLGDLSGQRFGHGMASHTVKAKVRLTSTGKEYFLFIKLCQEGSMPHTLNKMLLTFDKEIMFYTKIYPVMASNGVKFLPHFLGVGRLNKTDPCLAMEDFGQDGFKMVPKEHFLTVEQINLAMSTIAQFHAISKCGLMTDTDGNDILSQLAYYLQDWMLETDEIKKFFCDPVEHYATLMKALVEEKRRGNKTLSSLVIPDGVNLEMLEQLKSRGKDMMKVLRKTRTPPDGPEALLCHGDYHQYNVAFKQNPSDGKMEIKIFDLQAPIISSFAVDIHQFLSQTCTPEVRKQHLGKFLATYSEQFILSCQGHNHTPEAVLTAFSLENVIQEYKKRSAIGYHYGFGFLMIKFVKDISALQDLLVMESSADIVQGLANCTDDICGAFQIYFDLLKEHLELGTFEAIETILSR